MRLSYIAVAGVMGSGKTTLARNLSRVLRWRYVPESPKALKYLPDLFADQARLALPAQLSFLSDKAVQALELRDSGIPFVLDRSLREDVEVFAAYFRRHGFIDERDSETYRLVSEFFVGRLGPPSALILCECPMEVVMDRQRARALETGKDYVSRYPAGHVEEIHDAYVRWSAGYSEAPIIRVDTVAGDYRRLDEVRELLDRIDAGVSSGTSPQIGLFTGGHSEVQRKSASAPLLTAQAATRPYPSVYIAAPFTSVAVSDDDDSTPLPSLFNDAAPHGRIPVGWYRQALLGLARKLEKRGLTSLLPHRDINAWGAKHLNARDVYEACTAGVGECDAFVGVLGQSFGSHYEFGIARGLGKPCLIIHCSELPDSFVASGTIASESVMVCECPSIRDLPSVVDRPDVISFLQIKLGLK